MELRRICERTTPIFRFRRWAKGRQGVVYTTPMDNTAKLQTLPENSRPKLAIWEKLKNEGNAARDTIKKRA